MADFKDVATNIDILAIANAIRSITRTTEPMTIPEMPERLKHIQVVEYRRMTVSLESATVPLGTYDADIKHLFMALPVSTADAAKLNKSQPSLMLGYSEGNLSMTIAETQSGQSVELIVADILLDLDADTIGILIPAPNATDAALDAASENPVQNKVVTEALAQKASLVGGKVPESQLPSYVDDVLEFASLSVFPQVGEAGKIYVALDTDYTYRWSGSAYVRINDADLSDYYTKAETAAYIATALLNYVTSTQLATTLEGYVTTVALQQVLENYSTTETCEATYAKKEDVYTKTESDAQYATKASLAQSDLKIARNKKDIEYLYRQVIGGGDLVTATDLGVALTSQPFPLTVSPKALLDYVGGMCQKVNQLLSTSDFVATSSQLGVTKTNNGDGSFTMSGTADGGTAYLYFLSRTKSLVQSHKYCVFALGNFNKIANIRIRAKTAPDSADSYFGANTIVTGYVSFDQIFFSVPDGETASGSVFLTLVDISDAYPTDTPTSTSDPRIQWLMSYLAEHPEYDAGSIITAPVTKVVSKGFNLWDEEWEQGYYSDSLSPLPSNSNIRSKNFIEVKPNTTYYFYNVSSTNTFKVFYCDSQGNLISGRSEYFNRTITTPEGCTKIKFYCYSQYGGTYNHDICINVSSSLNGTYMPWTLPIEYPIPAEVRALEGYGYGLSDTLYNYIDFADKKYVKKVVRVDLGSLNWTHDNEFDMWVCASFTQAKSPSSNTGIARVISSLYEADSVSNMIDVNNRIINTIGISTGHSLDVYNGSSTTQPSGDLYFELAIPVETDISEYIDSDVIEVSAGGFLEFENEDDMGVPYSATYQCEPETQGGE